MPESRTLPIPSEHREFTVKSNGSPVAREHQLLAASVSSVANRIAWARLRYVDGSASAGGFPLTDSDVFVPGKAIEILAGAGTETHSLFKGIVVRISVRVREKSAAQLVVDCRHPASKLTLARRCAVFADRTDAEAIEEILAAAGIPHEVEATSIKHRRLVQYRTSDWDFITARADAVGKLVLSKQDGLTIKSPTLSRPPVCRLQYGATLLEFDAEIDARSQPVSVEGVTWNPDEQEVVRVEGDAPTFKGPGDLADSTLAAAARSGTSELRHSALAEDESKAWADAVRLGSRLEMVVGRGKCEGIGVVNPGDVVTLAGVGSRFDGDVFVTGVRHEYDMVQGWKTHVQFGGVDEPRGSKSELSAPAAGGLLAGVSGLQIGVVVGHEDPEGERRVRVRLPLVEVGDDGVWARVAAPDAGKDRGLCFLPEPGDEVVVGFLDDDPRFPVILGSLHSAAKPAPLSASDRDKQKLYKTRSGLTLRFDDEKKVLRLETSAGNRLTLDETEKSVTLADQNGNKIALTPDGIKIESAKGVSLKASAELALEAGSAFSAKGTADLKLEGGFKAELSSGGTTKVVGAMVMIN